MPSTWPTTKITGDEIPASEWNGIVDFGIQKPSSAALTAGRIIFSDGTNVITTSADLAWRASDSNLKLSGAQPGLWTESTDGDTNQKAARIVYEGKSSIIPGGGWVFQRLTDVGVFSANLLVITQDAGELGLGTIAPDTLLHLAATDSAISIDESANTPANPPAGTRARVYVKADKLIIQFNDGTVRYKYLLLSGTGVTWVHTLTAP